MLKKCIVCILILLLVTSFVFAQDRAILIPKKVAGAPYVVEDSQDLFGKTWRFYRDGFTDLATDSLKKLISLFGFEMNKNDYYIVVANFNDAETPIGMLHGDSYFHDTRIYGLKSSSLYYIYISREEEAKSYLSTVLTSKSSYFEEVLPYFIGLFPIFSQATAQASGEYRTWMDVRKFDIPKKFQKYCDINVVVKKDLSDERVLAHEVFDNSSLERWGFGIGTAITSADDVDITLENGVIVVRPKPELDLATFGLINFFFKPVDTKARQLATSFHLCGGLRISETIEPILGLGFGIPVDFIDLHLFAGYSVEFAQDLEEGYHVGQEIIEKDADPFKLNIRGKPRFGIEIRFP
ncbi:hypothetical protein B6I21_09030 [candidate division KSB1 bacterium 4572_119]|nr:MAG: hypothetical protein B6I21_09030 [candidate division KSB1 bacterium 4572_119]